MAFYLKVTFIGGTTVREAASELCNFARKLGVTVEGNFNGTTLIAYPRKADPSNIVRWYNHRQHDEGKVSMAFSDVAPPACERCDASKGDA